GDVGRVGQVQEHERAARAQSGGSAGLHHARAAGGVGRDRRDIHVRRRDDVDQPGDQVLVTGTAVDADLDADPVYRDDRPQTAIGVGAIGHLVRGVVVVVDDGVDVGRITRQAGHVPGGRGLHPVATVRGRRAAYVAGLHALEERALVAGA